MSALPPPRRGDLSNGPTWHHVPMSIVKRAKSTATAPLRKQADYVSKSLEDLIHSVKNELAARFDSVDGSIEELGTASSDQFGLMSSRVSTLEAEVRALRSELAALKKLS